MSEAAAILTTLWALGTILLFGAGLDCPRDRPPGWPWLCPLWPLLLIGEQVVRRYDGWRTKRRLRRMLQEVWKR